MQRVAILHKQRNLFCIRSCSWCGVRDAMEILLLFVISSHSALCFSCASPVPSLLMRAVLLLAVLALLAVSGVDAAASGKCHALAMSGGGDKAAYEAGVLRGLLEALPASETQWNVVTGISAGSTLTAAMSVFAVGDESSAVDLIYSIIDSLNQTTIFKQWSEQL